MALREKDLNVMVSADRNVLNCGLEDVKGASKSMRVTESTELTIADKENQPPPLARMCGSARPLKATDIKNTATEEGEDLSTWTLHESNKTRKSSEKRTALTSLQRAVAANARDCNATAPVARIPREEGNKANGAAVSKGINRLGFSVEMEVLGHARTVKGRAAPKASNIVGSVTEKLEQLSFAKAVGKSYEEAPSSAFPFVLGASSSPVQSGFEKEETVPPEAPKYNILIRELAGSTEPDAAQKAEDLLRDMITNYYAGVSDEVPDGSCYNTVIHLYAQQSLPDRAEEILRLMYEDFNSGNKNAEPNVRIYTSVLYAWEKSRKDIAPERCEQMLERMQQLYDAGAAPLCKPDLFTYTVCLHCWADSSRKDAPQRAERLFRKLLERFRAGDSSLCPDTIAYSNLMNAFAQTEFGFARAEDILWEMVQDYLNGNQSAKPMARSFNTVLAMWSKSKSQIAPERAEAIVQRVLSLNKSGKLDVKPDKYSYSLLLKTWAKSDRRDSAERAEQALYWMMQLYNEGDEDAQPDLIKYTTCISCLAHSRSPDRAEALLDNMIDEYVAGAEHSKPDNKCFNTVLAGWSRHRNSKTASIRAEALIRRMWIMYDSKVLDIQPDTWMYNTAVFCWKNASNPERAEALLREMESKHDRGLLRSGPDETTYRAVIQAWQRSSYADKTARVSALELEYQQAVNWNSDDDIQTRFGCAVANIVEGTPTKRTTHNHRRFH